QAEPAADMFDVDGMTDELAAALAAKGIATRDDLAEQATDDLLELIEMDEAEAAKLIMAARAHWFEEEQA
ncbi:MAG: helix-hairpin-helix domain-containing protein, partial [Pseudomonadota bacterium]